MDRILLNASRLSYSCRHTADTFGTQWAERKKPIAIPANKSRKGVPCRCTMRIAILLRTSKSSDVNKSIATLRKYLTLSKPRLRVDGMTVLTDLEVELCPCR